jgi:hypothetical protein
LTAAVAGLIAVGAVVLGTGGVAVAAPVVTVTPNTGLAEGQTVQVSGSGYTAGKTLGITQCSDQGAATGQGDCDVPNIRTVTADSAGNVSSPYVVRAGPFGANNRVCDPNQRCLVSLGELTGDPNAERATAPLTFGGGPPATSPVAAAVQGNQTTMARTGPGDFPWALLIAGVLLAALGTFAFRISRPLRGKHFARP